MKKEELIKKLERIKAPEIEIPSHKAGLKRALISWKYRQKAGGFSIGFKKILMPVGVATIVILIFITGINLFFPQDALAEARKIAMKNPQIKEWVEKGAEIKDIKITKNRAYVLISPKELSTLGEIPKTTMTKDERFKGALVQIELKEKTISKIEEITPQIIPLTQQEEEKAKNIINELEFPTLSSTVKNQNEKTIRVEKVEPVPTYNLKLIQNNGGVEILPEKTENEKIKIIYRIDGEKKEGEVNLTEEKVEQIKILEQDETGNPEK